MNHKRIVVTRYGAPDVLQVTEEPPPEPKAGEVRVKVLKPLIAKIFPLVEARQEHELLGKGGVIGKIVLEPA